jgi:hypothetical protein
MLQRILRSVGLWVAALGLLCGGPLAAQAAPTQRIIAVGDLHGDFHAWTDIARAAGLIDSAGRWTGGRTLVVQLGDVTDRGPDSLKIIRSLQRLQKEAPRSGGRVVVVLGNHEAMNLLGDLRYTTPGEFTAFVDGRSAERRGQAFNLYRDRIEAAYRAQDPKMSAAAIRAAWLKMTPLGWVEHNAAWRPDGELGRWARGNPAVLKVGDTLFVHGGLSVEYSKLPLDEVNRQTAAAMAKADDNPKSILNDPLGPLWYRGLVSRDPDAEAARGPPTIPRLSPPQELTAVLTAYGAKRIVIGHTPSLAGINISPDGRLARIDTGISSFYGGPLTWLEIVGDRMTPHTTRRTAP